MVKAVAGNGLVHRYCGNIYNTNQTLLSPWRLPQSVKHGSVFVEPLFVVAQGFV